MSPYFSDLWRETSYLEKNLLGSNVIWGGCGIIVSSIIDFLDSTFTPLIVLGGMARSNGRELGKDLIDALAKDRSNKANKLI